DERRSHAELRLQQLVEERSTLLGRMEGFAEEIRRADEARALAADAAAAARKGAEGKAAENSEGKAALAAARAAAGASSTRAAEPAREIATAEGERSGAERRRRDALEHHAEATAHRQSLESQLGHLTGQTELWESQADEIRARLDSADAALTA